MTTTDSRPVTVPDWPLVRRLAPDVLGTLVRRYGHFDSCEDAVQEALLAAARQWPAEGWPASPKAWLITVASRRLTDELRSAEARRRREELDQARTPRRPEDDHEHDDQGPVGDDTLTLLFLCCHPALSPASQVALTLRAIGGLTTAEIARAFLVPEATMTQRIGRAKERIRAAGATFRLPPADEQRERLRVVLHVLYLVFNEGYTATAGTNLVRDELTAEAIRLTRLLLRLVPDDGEVAGLLALMLLTEARRAARVEDEDGSLVPLREQDRSSWDADAIAEGVALVTGALGSKPLGPYQLQQPSPPSTTRRPPLPTPTGPRSSPCIGCSSGSTRARSSRSTRRWRSPWWTGPRPAWRWSSRSPATHASTAPTTSTRCAGTSWSWPVITTRHGRPIEPQLGGRRACPSNVTCSPAPPACADRLMRRVPSSRCRRTRVRSSP